MMLQTCLEVEEGGLERLRGLCPDFALVLSWPGRSCGSYVVRDCLSICVYACHCRCRNRGGSIYQCRVGRNSHRTPICIPIGIQLHSPKKAWVTTNIRL